MRVTEGDGGRAPSGRAKRALAMLACVLTAGLCAAAPASATLALQGPALRVSTVGADNDARRTASDPQVAYNSAAGEYLVVWAANGINEVGRMSKVEIYAQRLSASGAELGADFRISTTPTEADERTGAARPSVAYNGQANEYFVVWHADAVGADDKFEVFGQRVSAAGAEIGTDLQLSTTGAPTEAARDATDASVAVDQAGNYLVVWAADGLATVDQDEIFGQRVSPTGTELGVDFRISRTGTADSVDRDAARPRVAYGSVANEFLVVWQADALPVDDKFEIRGQLITATGLDDGPNFRISSTGFDSDAARDATDASVAFNTNTNQFLVAWEADGLAIDDEVEIFGQRISVGGAEEGVDFRISSAGADGDAARDAENPSVAFSGPSGEYLVAWEADGLATDDEFEIFGQRVGATGAEVGADFRVSATGADGDAARDASAAAVTSSGPAGEYLAVWRADGLATDGEFEVFAQRLTAPPGPAQPPPPPAPAPAPPGPPGSEPVLPDPVVALTVPPISGPAPRIDDDPVRVTLDGRIPIELTCAETGTPCTGVLVLETARVISGRLLATASARRRSRRVLLGRVSYTIPSGRRTRASVRLSRSNRRLVRRVGAIRTRVTVTPRGGGRSTSRTITVRRPRRR